RKQVFFRWFLDRGQAPKKVPKNEVALEGASSECWLVKIAPSVWKAWETLEKGDSVGNLVVRTIRTRKADGTIVEEKTMSVKTGGMETKFKGGAKAKLPDYQLSGKRDIEDALAFTRPPTGELGSTAIAATIKRQYLMQPEMGSSYTNLVKRRLVSNTMKERTTEEVGMAEVHKAARDTMSRKGTAFDAAFHRAQQ
ncbi:unnamed protein product, partial [Sphacelaria rigidula]